MKNLYPFVLIIFAMFISCSESGKSTKEQRQDIPLSRNEIEAVEDINALSSELMTALDGAVEDNFVVSPLSLTYALGMMANGAVGQTQQQMLNVLKMGSDDINSLNELTKKLLENLPIIDVKTSVRMANSLWMDYSVQGQIKSDFIEKLNVYYNADATIVKDLAGSEGMAAINSWVKQHTAGYINQMLSKPLDGSSKVACVNALYFKGLWSQQFVKTKTSNKRFTLLDKSFSYVPTMEQEGMNVQAYSEADYRAVAVPYGNGAYSLIILLPNEGLDPLKTFASASIADLTKLAKWEMFPTSIHIRLPKYTVDTQIDWAPVLKVMGMTIPFALNADFQGIMDSDFKLNKLLQESKIIVDEEGTIAVSATVSSGGDTAYKPDYTEFFVDRPFAFAIAERSTGIFLFIGAVRKL